jgi:uncharacterized protein YkwD
MNLLKSCVVCLVVVLGGLSLQGQAQANPADDVVAYTNEVRQRAGLPPLRGNDRLATAAMAHAKQMAREDTLSHVLDGKNAGDRIAAAGYRFSCWGENLAWLKGYDDPAAEAVKGWLDSPGHRRNLLHPDFTEIGVAYWTAADGKVYFCQVFGSR